MLMRHRSDEELAHEASRLCSIINQELAMATEVSGFVSAHHRMFTLAPAIAPGWDWIETTERADASPTVCLTQYRGSGR